MPRLFLEGDDAEVRLMAWLALDEEKLNWSLQQPDRARPRILCRSGFSIVTSGQLLRLTAKVQTAKYGNWARGGKKV